METERVVVITGSTGGIGRYVSHRFAAAGYRLALVGTNQSRLDQLVRELNLPESKVLTCVANLSESDGAQKVHQAVSSRYGKTDILLHFIGGWIGGKAIPEVTSDEVTEMLNQHTWTTFYLLKAFLPEMRKHGWGRIVAISSPVAGTPPANDLPYVVGKAGQEAILMTAAEELRYTGITANILRVRTIDLDYEREQAMSDKNAFWTTLEEIAVVIEYLCTEAGGAVNGARIPLYGSP